MDAERILDILSEQKVYLHNKYGFDQIMLFGSYAKNLANENSDIDLAVTLPCEYKSFDNLLDSKLELSTMLGGKKIDLVYYESEYINPIIKRKIDMESLKVE